MKLHKVMAVALVSLSPFALGACGGGSEGVTNPGPRYPGVSGNWRGEWSGSRSTVTLNLTQNQNRVAGTLTVGNEVNEVSGTIDEFGVLEFDGRDTDESNGCTAYYSDRPHLALSDQNSVLEGPVLISPAATRRSPGCTTS